MRYEHLRYDKDGRGVAITLNRPEKINALNEALTRAFEAAMLAAKDGVSVKVAALKGASRGCRCGT